MTAALSVKIVAEAFGRVKVFSVEAGQESFANPFPVPPYVEAIICVRAALPSKLFP